jgi:hypothetical protein
MDFTRNVAGWSGGTTGSTTRARTPGRTRARASRASTARGRTQQGRIMSSVAGPTGAGNVAGGQFPKVLANALGHDAQLAYLAGLPHAAALNIVNQAYGIS